MTRLTDSFAQAHNYTLRKEQNALAQDKYNRAIERDNQYRNILADSYTQPQAAVPAQAAIPEMGVAPAMGAIQPGMGVLPDYPAQAAIPAQQAVAAQPSRFDLSGAEKQLMGAGFLPEALQVREMAEGAGGGGIGTYNPRDYTSQSWAQFVKGRDPSQLKRYTEKTVNLGGVEHQLIPDRGYVPLSTLKAEADAEAKLQAGKTRGKIITQTELGPELEFTKKLGAEGGKAYAKYQAAAQKASAFIPRLQSLKELANKVETGTGAEVAMIAKRALGVDTSDMEVLNAKLGELAQDILNEQTGTKTDFDFENAVRQSAALGKTPKANALLINALIARQQQAVNFGDQAKKAYSSYGAKGVLDMRYQSGRTRYKVGDITKGPDGKNYVVKSLKADGTPNEVMLAQ